MNVFVLCTGRCGSTTFIRACEHISNFSASHESRTHLLGSERFAYPPRHIEADNRLSWLLGRLERHYGDQAYYVHLRRNLAETALSFATRKGGIMAAYRSPGIIMRLSPDADPLEVATDYCHTVTSNIELFLRDKSNKFVFDLEEAGRQFPDFCAWIGAEVSLEGALREFSVRHNAST